MKRPTASAAFLGAVLCAATAPTVHAGYESGTSTTRRAAAALSAHAGVLVRFKPGTSAAERAAARRAAGVRRERGFAVNGLEAVTPAPAGAEAAVVALRRDPDVLYAEPDRTRKAARVPSDPLFEFQWALTRIAAPAAWDTTTGSPEVVVGVADTGADLDHPDLAPNLIRGWDFVDGDARRRGPDRARHPRGRDRRRPRRRRDRRGRRRLDRAHHAAARARRGRQGYGRGRDRGLRAGGAGRRAGREPAVLERYRVRRADRRARFRAGDHGDRGAGDQLRERRARHMGPSSQPSGSTTPRARRGTT